MSTRSRQISLPEAAIAQFDSVENSDWSEGVGLEELVEWINWVADRFRPEEIGDSTRSSQEFTARSFRHYQTLGCIDKPERVGRKGVYRFRQYLQALLIRKLLWERVPSAQIVALMDGRSNEELKQLLFEGIEIVPGQAQALSSSPAGSTGSESWTRLSLAPGMELHLRADRPALSPTEVEALLDRVREQLGSR